MCALVEGSKEEWKEENYLRRGHWQEELIEVLGAFLRDLLPDPLKFLAQILLF